MNSINTTEIIATTSSDPVPTVLVSSEEHLSSNLANDGEDVLIGLIGNNAPSLPLEALRKSVGLKANEHADLKLSSSSSKWCLKPFENPARKDGLKLKHWSLVNDQQVYKFAKYNTTSNVFSYTTEEYYRFLREDDWTKEETDYLFKLLHAYDLRFPVVHDRYDFLGNERSVDDLKARYYSICQKLIHHRHNTADENTKKHLTQNYNFDKQREIERKSHLQSLLNRTPAQLAEEEFLYVETRRLEQNLLKRARNRDELMKLIGGAQYQMFNDLKLWPPTEPQPPRSINLISTSRAPSTAAPIGSSSSHSTNLTQPGKRNPSRGNGQVEESGITDASTETPKAVDPAVQLVEDKKNCVHRFDPSAQIQYRSVGFRSTRITLPKTVAASTRLSGIMTELQIPILVNLPKPLIMPTRTNVESYEGLIQAANQLADLKRQVDRMEAELSIQRKKRDAVVAANASKYQTEAEVEEHENGDSVAPTGHEDDPFGSDGGNLQPRSHKRSASVSSTNSL
ncbi:hypothetical protein O181_033093 [Austropuccinia psidii MF-1]|uniref:SWR1-complex protein 4 n=1 Tax=Austropuccinia psidii MF-1 TaxID=1389203 RepID=A0A9Q3D2X2_9BASI|nr:hypothetical protein [Austropuccinia psidii MF-1]